MNRNDEDGVLQGVNLARHASQCSICKGSHREQIEWEWVNWGNTTQLADRFILSPYSIYQHCRAVGLFEKRRQNLRVVYEKIIERQELADFSGGNILKALEFYQKLMATQPAASVPAPPAVPGSPPKELEAPAAPPVPEAEFPAEFQLGSVEASQIDSEHADALATEVDPEPQSAPGGHAAPGESNASDSEVASELHLEGEMVSVQD